MDMPGMDSNSTMSVCKISMLWNWYTVDTCFISSSWHNRSTSMFIGSCFGVVFLTISLAVFRRLSGEYDRFILRQHARSIPAKQKFSPNLLQQGLRATLHMVQFAIAYFIMLLAMYYNGYIIISILVGAWLGAFFFTWGSVNLGDSSEEATLCCG